MSCDQNIRILLWIEFCIPCYVGPCRYDMVSPRVVDVGYGLRMCKVAENTFNKQPQTADKG